MQYKVVQEKVFEAKSTPGKAFCLHKIQNPDGSNGFRLGYYMIGQKPRMKGKWVWGQFAPMMTKKELADIFAQVKALGWL